MNTDSHSPSDIHKILELKNIAVVGMSNTEGNLLTLYPIPYRERVRCHSSKSYYNRSSWEKAYPKVSDVPEQVDIVDIFRRSEDVRPVVDDAIKKKGIKVIWMQSGIYNKDAERKAKENGIDVVYNRCMKVEHSVLID